MRWVEVSSGVDSWVVVGGVLESKSAVWKFFRSTQAKQRLVTVLTRAPGASSLLHSLQNSCILTSWET